ncbi:MAG: dihydroorotate dehydrogenase electron transfer subunit [Desulfarculus sp.]|nr:dihydroorotate dehydrogenase electron transfer subunit [Desulfarculus sp.]
MSDWAAIKENKQVGEGVYRLRLTAPAIAAQAQPGQFIMLRVSHGLDPLLARPFSIHGVDGDDLLILYKVVGKGTRLLSMVRPGNKTLSLWGPLGRGFNLDVKRPVLVAGGMGIAPIVFLADTLLNQGRKKLAFVHGAVTGKALFGGSEELRTTLLGRDLEPYLASEVEGEERYYGLIGVALEPALSSFPDSSPCGGVLACGPLPMLKAVAQICARHKVPCQVSLEAPMACGLGACLGCVIPAAGGGYVRACQEGPVMDAALVDWERTKP